jgi:acyl-CoA thioesterase-1
MNKTHASFARGLQARRRAFTHLLLQGALAALLTLTGTGAQAAPRNLLILGDSISAEYGLPRDSGWVRLLAERLKKSAYDYNVVNASISGDTTISGRGRLPALLRQHTPAIVIIELGGNDGLRGLDPRAMEDHLAAMINAASGSGARVLLVGMRLPPNYGRDYNSRFEAVYPALAARLKVPLVKFLFEGLGQTDEFFQADRIHPTVRSQALLLDNVWPVLKPLLRQGKT